MLQPLSYPEEAGAAIGGPSFNRYVMLEVHYNNPAHKKGNESRKYRPFMRPYQNYYDVGAKQ